MNPKVDFYFSDARQWQKELAQLRVLLLDCGLTEELKWGKPCYSYEGSNIVVIQGFKAYCAILFFKGVLLNDPEGILVKTGENTRVGRQIRFNNVKEITGRKAILKAYVYEAIEVEKAGLKVDKAAQQAPAVAKEFQQRLAKNRTLKAAFEALTPGRQRAYHIYFAAPKQPETRQSRMEKWIPQILRGKGMND